jgi:hypothetical protein
VRQASGPGHGMWMKIPAPVRAGDALDESPGAPERITAPA